MNNIYLLTHTGGDGAHFLMYLLSKYTNEYGQQHFPDKHASTATEKNDWRYVENPLTHDSEEAFDYIDECIRNGIKWHEQSEFKLSDGISSHATYLQQVHVQPQFCTTELVGKDKMVCTVASMQAHYYIARLDRMKQDDLVAIDLEQFIVDAAESAVFKSHQLLYAPADDLKIFYLDFDRLILHADYSEFLALTDFLDLTVVYDAEAHVPNLIRNYVSANNKALEEFSDMPDTLELRQRFYDVMRQTEKRLKQKPNLQWYESVLDSRINHC